MRQAAALLRCSDKQLWRRIEHYVNAARALDDMSGVSIVGIDETSLRKGQSYITLVHDLQAKRLLFACEGRDHQSVLDFASELKAHDGEPAQIKHVCQDMSAAYAKGVGLALPQAQISWARRSRLEPFKKCAATLKQRLAGVVCGMLDNRSNAYVEAMSGLLQQAKRAARASERQRTSLPPRICGCPNSSICPSTRCSLRCHRLAR